MAEQTLMSRKRPCPPKPDSRCVVCGDLFSARGLRELRSDDGYAHRTREGVEASIKEGCSLCEFLYQVGMEKFNWKWPSDDCLVFRTKPQSSRHAALTVLQGRIEGSDEVMTIYPFAKRGDPLATLIPRRPMQRDVQSEAVFAAARKLIHACLRTDKPSKGHQMCRYSRDTVLPTRVLDVGDPASSDPHIRLKVNETETHGSYLALSYCWGKPLPNSATEPLWLRRNNLRALTSRIPPEKLEKSLQDAIWVARKLKFKYLWIDALCIIQDDKEDKDQELSRMATIYKNATITLAAGTAKRASKGFLGASKSRPTVYLPEHKFAIPMDEGSEMGTVYLAAEPYKPDHPLDKRGWTLQEFMLSSRMLIFSDYQLLWQCKEVELRSVTGDSRGLEYQQPLESLPWKVFDEEEEPLFGTADSEKLYSWRTIILQYTERNLTDPNDRLRAISGITTELEKLWRDSNIWGLWRQWFVSLLAWCKVGSDRVEKRNLKRAPSWSWASLDGRIRYQDPLEVEDAKVKTLTVTSVVLSCRVLNTEHIGVDDLEIDDGHQYVHEWPDLDDPAWRSELGQRELLWLLLGTTKGDDDGSEGLGLLVIKVANGRYRRIGLALFPDMSIWKGVGWQTIEFEPKQ